MCAVSDSGTVWCWGADAKQQLGTSIDGATDKYSPTQTDSTGGEIRSVATGNDYTCALRGTGVVVCWGDNSYGQLARTPTFTTGSAAPTVVSIAANITKVSAGGTHACALSSSGELWCWGRNQSGQIGDGTGDLTKTSAVKVTSLGAAAVDVAAGLSHTCALLITGAVKCWGDNSYGQVGAVDGLNHSTPVTVAGLDENATATSLVSSTPTDSSARVTGSVDVPLGEATYTVERSAAADFTTVASTAALGTWGRVAVASTSSGHGCVVLVAGTVSCRGTNTDGQVGNGTTTDSVDPVNVTWTKRAVHVATGGAHTCAIESEGIVSCWGDNSNGQLGNGTVIDSGTPVQVALETGEKVIDLSTGTTSSCVVTDAGAVRCWGSNSAGELGNDSTTPTQSLVTVPLGEIAIGVSVGDHRACAALASGKAMCWGAGRPGDGSSGGTTALSTVVLANGTVRQVVTSGGHSCALVVGGEVKCWGNDATVDSVSPVGITFGDGAFAVAVAASGAATCVRLASGSVQCVGEAGDARTRATHVLDPSTVPSHSSRSLSHTFTGLPDATKQWYRYAIAHSGTVTYSAAASFTTDTTTTTTSTEAPTTTPAPTSTDAATTTQSPTTTTAETTTLATSTSVVVVSSSSSSVESTTSVVSSAISSVSPSTSAVTSVVGQSTFTTVPVVTSSNSVSTSLSNPAHNMLAQAKVIHASHGSSVSAARIARSAGLYIPRKSEGRLRISIVWGAKRCVFVGSYVRAQHSGSCRVRVELIRHVGRVRTSTVTISVAR